MRNARAMTHPGDDASIRASRVCIRTYCVHLYVHTTGVSRYTLRHSDTAVPRKEFLAHARSMSVSVFWILIVSLRSRVRTIAMRRKGASTWSIILIASWILISSGLAGPLYHVTASLLLSALRAILSYLFNLWLRKKKSLQFHLIFFWIIMRDHKRWERFWSVPYQERWKSCPRRH